MTMTTPTGTRRLASGAPAASMQVDRLRLRACVDLAHRGRPRRPGCRRPGSLGGRGRLGGRCRLGDGGALAAGAAVAAGAAGLLAGRWWSAAGSARWSRGWSTNWPSSFVLTSARAPRPNWATLPVMVRSVVTVTFVSVSPCGSSWAVMSAEALPLPAVSRPSALRTALWFGIVLLDERGLALELGEDRADLDLDHAAVDVALDLLELRARQARRDALDVGQRSPGLVDRARFTVKSFTSSIAARSSTVSMSAGSPGHATSAHELGTTPHQACGPPRRPSTAGAARRRAAAGPGCARRPP